MKLRTGFVSNSSSSSFVMLGVNVSEEELFSALKVTPDEDGVYGDVVQDKLNEENLFVLNASEFDNGKGYYAGVAFSDAEQLADFQVGQKEIHSIAHRIEKMFGKKDVKLIGGSRAC